MERPDVAVVQANTQWPDDALLLVYSSLDGVQFRSSMGAVDKQTYNNTAGRYEILVKPLKQMIFVAKPGFMELKIATINPNPKDVFYYQIEELKSSDEQRLKELKSLLREGILTNEQYETFVAQIKGSEDEIPKKPIENVDAEVSFRTYSDEEKLCKDIEGNVYPTTQIGNQLWMAENLKTGRYADGTPIEEVKKKKEWFKKATGAYCEIQEVFTLDTYYSALFKSKSKKEIKNKLGKIYNWQAVDDSRGICPNGWRAPSKSDMEELIRFLEQAGAGSEALKTTRQGVWLSDEDSDRRTNTSGFSAFPVASRKDDGEFDDSRFTRWWTGTQAGNSAYYFGISAATSTVMIATKNKLWGMPCRCVKE